MKRRATTGGKVGKARRRKTQSRRAARVVARRGSSDASLREQLDQSRRERDEALEQQAATSEVLNVIRNSPSNTQPVFDAIVRSGLKLFANAAITIALPQGGQVVAGAIADADPKRAEALRRRLPIPLRREFMHSLAIIDGKIVDVPDVDNPPAHLASGAKNFRASGFRAVTIVPMMQSGTAIGALSVARVAPGPLSDKQNAILQTFAAQAVIAIENTRLLNELRKSLAAADRHRRGAEGHQPVHVRLTDRAEHAFRVGCTALRCRARLAVSSRWRGLEVGSELRPFRNGARPH